MMEKKITPIIIGTSYSTIYGVLRSLGETGIRSDIILMTLSSYQHGVFKSSKYVGQIHSFKRQVDSGELVRFLINEYKNRLDKEILILLTTGDFSASFCDTNYDALSSVFLMPHSTKQGEIVRLMDKTVQCQMAEELGIAVAKHWSISLEETPLIPDDIVYPCYVKSALSIYGSKREMSKCDNRQDLLNTLESFSKFSAERDVVLQEFLDIEDEFIVTGVCADQAIFAPAISRRIKVAEKNKGLTVCGEIIDLDVLGDNKDLLIKLLQAFHYTGMFGMDVFKCRDGRILFNEMNFRTTGVIYAITRAGANLPAMLIDGLIGREITYNSNDMAYGLVFFHDVVAWKEYLCNTLKYADIKKYRKMSSFSTFNSKEDSGPYKHLMRHVIIKMLILPLKKILKGRNIHQRMTKYHEV